ncbi:MAG: redoxin domain-containing protein [Anaerolineales bacterium]|nr:redoxin domain-containing protein [Anaerolineales bacterium]
MAQLRRDHEEFVARDTVVVIVGPESEQKFQSYFREHELPFVGLPDPKHEVLRQYGQEIKIFKFGRMPAQVLIDKQGIARFVHYGHDMTDIPETAEMLALLDELEGKG